jgi:hypothetical protein
MSTKNTKFLLELIHESVESGKIKAEHKCPFCGSMLGPEQLEVMETRIGRLKFLFGGIENGSETARETLDKVLFRKKIYDGKDIPETEEYPDWWVEAVRKIDEERREHR